MHSKHRGRNSISLRTTKKGDKTIFLASMLYYTTTQHIFPIELRATEQEEHILLLRTTATLMVLSIGNAEQTHRTAISCYTTNKQTSKPV